MNSGKTARVERLKLFIIIKLALEDNILTITPQEFTSVAESFSYEHVMEDFRRTKGERGHFIPAKMYLGCCDQK